MFFKLKNNNIFSKPICQILFYIVSLTDLKLKKLKNPHLKKPRVKNYDILYLNIVLITIQYPLLVKKGGRSHSYKQHTKTTEF